ncbi:Hypothetical protein FKW44_007371 [Caligus rogercresseyi]|uniref:Uncharacterized protein n=1 Tax=Caligus rogercresseyi TaxID=217165 RepID=A0A7T8KEZ0_CALRO|nr:Hypothetical protein FKW44_007371 [Caligus rogercresseyi]
MAHQKRVHREENEESTPPLKKRKRPSKMNKFPLNSGSEDLPPVEEGYGNLVSSSHEEQQQSMQVSTPRKPQVQQQQYWKPAPAPSSTKTMDLQKIGRKLGGQISITSSETEHPPPPPQTLPPILQCLPPL